MVNPLISVIVPNYNHEKFLRQRLDSIYLQTYKNIEVIILDDCSTDNSCIVIEQYRNRPQTSTIVYNKINSGSPFKQWAKGIALSKGSLIWVAESDDYCELNLLEQLEVGLAKPDCVLAYSEIIHVNELGMPLETKDAVEAVWLNGKEFIKRQMILGTYLVNSGMVVFKKRCLTNISEKYQQFIQCGDYSLHVDICLQGDVYASGKPLAYFRRHQNAFTYKWVFTQTYFREIMIVFNRLFLLNIVNEAPLRKLITEELVTLYCIKGGISKNEFLDGKNFWHSVGREYQLPFPFLKAWFLAKCKKINHFLSK